MKVTEKINNWYEKHEETIIMIGIVCVSGFCIGGAYSVGAHLGSFSGRVALSERIKAAAERGMIKFFDPETNAEVTDWNKIADLINSINMKKES